MRYSQYYIPTLKEEPSEAEIASHSYSLRAGLIRKIASGIYTYLPLGLRVLKKIEAIVREEMNRAGAIELVLPVMQPADLWKKSGRWDAYGPDMFKLKDRNSRDFCLGPTHEEIITYLSYLDIKSYKDLPVNLYQIQVKFRDEIRPRYGLLRAREFIMKDAYSFCRGEEDLSDIYQKMYDAYSRIADRLGLRYKIVEAETGLIGGSFSHEFVVLAPEGEEVITSCPECGKSAQQDLIEYEPPVEKNSEEEKPLKEVKTTGVTTIEKLSEFLNVPAGKIVKAVVLQGKDKNMYAFLLSGERELNMSRAENAVGASLEMIEDKEIMDTLNIGFFGPINPAQEINIYADYSVKGKKNYVVGANKEDFHLINVNYPRDFEVKGWGIFSNPVEGDLCKNCGSRLVFEKGIEIGHIFKLGRKYSEKLDARFLDENGRLKPFEMGCYGIGISRIMSAAIEQSHDSKGIIWPKSITPFLINLIVTNINDEKLKQVGDEIYKKLLDMGAEVLYDDRNERAGVKFKDSELIGIPVRLIVGKNYFKNEKVEIEFREGTRDKTTVKISQLHDFINTL